LEAQPPYDRRTARLHAAWAADDNLNLLPQSYKRIRLEGAMYDAAGVQHEVRDSIEDLAGWRKALGEAHQRAPLYE